MYATFWNLVDIGINYLTIGAGFLPSTVSPLPFFWGGLMWQTPRPKPGTSRFHIKAVQFVVLTYIGKNVHLQVPPNTWKNGFGGSRIRSMKHLLYLVRLCGNAVHEQAHLTKLQRPQKSSADLYEWRIHGNPSKVPIEAFEAAIVCNSMQLCPIITFQYPYESSVPIRIYSSCQWPMMSTSKGCFLSQ